MARFSRAVAVVKVETHWYLSAYPQVREEIADGKWDHLPETAFMYVGSIEQAEEAAKKAAAKA